MNSFIHELNAILKEKSLLKHPFYKLWSAGKLTKHALQGYALDYYPLEAAFPSFLLNIAAKTDNKQIKKVVLDNYHEETTPKQIHADLWLDFAESVELVRDATKKHTPLPTTRATIKEFDTLTKKDILSGITVSLAYEANLQETSETKIEGLKKFYKIKEKKALHFFVLHSTLDTKHANDWKSILTRYAKTSEQKDKVKQTLRYSMDLLWKFLDGLHNKYNYGAVC